MKQGSTYNTAVTLNLFQGLTPMVTKIKMLKQVQHDRVYVWQVEI